MMKKASIGICAVVACAVAVLVARRHMKNSGQRARAMAILKEFQEKCATPAGKLKQIADAMAVEMHAGLASEGGSKLKMLITYVDNLPTGYLKFCLFLISILTQSSLILFGICVLRMLIIIMAEKSFYNQ